jgi:hypothetical protein
VERGALTARGHGVVLHHVSWLAHGPAHDKPPVRLTGYALFADGELVAAQPRSAQITIGAGQSVNLANDVIF